MTVWSQNGMSANDRSVIRTATIPGTNIQVQLRKGPVGDLLLYAAGRWNREVEPLEGGQPDEWGYAERTIRGSTTELSNHASGSALDLNATKHPLGTLPQDNFTAGQMYAIRKIVADCKGCLRWGGDYIGRKDGMHIEALGTEQGIAAVLAGLPNVMTTPADPEGSEDMALNEADLQKLIARLLATPLPDYYPDKVIRTMTLADVLAWACANAGRAETQAQGARADIAALSAKLDALAATVASLGGPR